MDLKQRLNNVLTKDKETNPKYLSNVIKSDFFYLISNYFEVEFDDISVDISVNENNQYTITLNCLGERVKLMKSIM